MLFRSINIFLHQFQVPVEDIIEKISEGDFNSLGLEKLKGLAKLLPDKEEESKIKSFFESEKLENAEQFMTKLVALER